MLLGNDVVDLDDPESAPERLHRRFDARVFGGQELALIAASVDPNRTRWLLWACKESAYKACKRLGSATVFSPVSFEVRWSEEDKAGVVRSVAEDTKGELHIPVYADYGPGHIHAVAGARGDGVATLVAPLEAGADPSGAARRLAASLLCPANPAGVEFRSEAKVPHAYMGGARIRRAVSLSHHGRFVAAAVGPPPKESAPTDSLVRQP